MSYDWQTLSLVGFVGLVGFYLVLNSYYGVSEGESGKRSKKGSIEPLVWKKFSLIKKTNVTHNTRLFRFKLPSSSHVLGLPIGKHIFLRCKDKNGEMVKRSYTPVSSDDDYGYFELMIKIYNDGIVTSYLDTLKLGDTIEVVGPHGNIEYIKPGIFEIKRKRNVYDKINVNKIGLIAGGTGITPMLQLIRHIQKDSNDNTQVSLIFGNVSINDILCRKELEEIRNNNKNNSNIKIYFTVDKLGEGEDNIWKEGVGYVTKQMISKHLPLPGKDVAVFTCGPPIMCKILKKTLTEMGYENLEEF